MTDAADRMSRMGGDRYGAVRLSEVGGNRWDVAMARLEEGGSIAYDDVGFRLVDPGRLTVSPEWPNERSPTVDDARRAFRRAEACL